MAFPTIKFNNSTGSNTAASGAGPSTALFGTNASYSGSVVTLDGSPNLSGVATDGSHVLWLKTSTGRQFFTINAANDGADTVTLDDAPAGTSTGRTWGIGGKRSTMDHADSRLALTTDAKNDWSFEVEYTGTNYITSSALTLVDKRLSITATGGRPKWDAQFDGAALIMNSGTWNSSGQQSRQRLTGFQFICTSGTKTNNYGVDHGGGAGNIIFEDCWFGSVTSGERVTNGCGSANGAVLFGLFPQFYNCRFLNTLENGFNANRAGLFFNCKFVDCGASSSYFGIAPRLGHLFGFGYQFHIKNCIFHNCGGKGAWLGGIEDAQIIVENCTFDGNGGDGLHVGDGSGDGTRIGTHVHLTNNVFTKNGGYGLNVDSTLIKSVSIFNIVDYNAFGSSGEANTSGARNNVAAGTHDVTISSDPYVNRASDNFRAASTSGLVGLGTPGPLSNDTGYVDIGALQHQDSGGTVGKSVIIRATNY